MLTCYCQIPNCLTDYCIIFTDIDQYECYNIGMTAPAHHQSGIAVSVVTANVDRQISVTTTNSNVNNTQPKASDYSQHYMQQPGKSYTHRSL